MITIEHLTKRFARATAVNDVTFSITAGESVALWGENGAGKTTIIRCILGLMRYDGAIRVDRLDAWRQGKCARRLIGYVPQELGFYDELRVHEAVRFFAKLKGERVRDIDAVLYRVGLVGHASKRIRELSGGMKQRLALAIALLGEPPILILDEVTASLDACGRAEMVNLLAGLAKSDSRAVLFASHRREEIAALATRVITLERGRMMSDVSARTFASRQTENTLLHVLMDASNVSRALELLRGEGFDARKNGRGIYVPVSGGSRAVPLQRLAAADIRVDDFDLVPPSREEVHP